MDDSRKDVQVKLDYLIKQGYLDGISEVMLDSALNNLLGFTKSNNALRTLICQTAGATAYGVYLQLLSHRDRETGLCYPSQATIAEELNISKPTVSRSVSSLFESGFLVGKSKNSQAKTLYYYFPYEDFTTLEQFNELVDYSNKSNINKIIKKPNSDSSDELFDDLDFEESEPSKKKKSESNSLKKSEPKSQKKSAYTIYYDLYKDLYAKIPDSSWDTMDYLKSYVPAQNKLILGLATLKLQQTKESYELIANGPESWYNSVSLDITTSLDKNLNLDSSSLLIELQEPLSELPKAEYVIPEQNYFYPEIKLEDRYNVNPKYKELLTNLPEYGKSITSMYHLKQAESTIESYTAKLREMPINRGMSDNKDIIDGIVPFNLILYALGIDYFLFCYYTDRMYPNLVTGNLLVNNPTYDKLYHPEVVYNSTFDSLLKENGPDVIRFLGKLKELASCYWYSEETKKLDKLISPLLEADIKIRMFKDLKASYDNKVHREEVEAKNKKTWENIAKAKSANNKVVLFPDNTVEEEQITINKKQELPVKEKLTEEKLTEEKTTIEEDDFDFEAELFALDEQNIFKQS